MARRASNCLERCRCWRAADFGGSAAAVGIRRLHDSVIPAAGAMVERAAELSRGEPEGLDRPLENLANKEVASKLDVSERTVQFHVSNLLRKFAVRRRADLILLCYQRRKAGP